MKNISEEKANPVFLLKVIRHGQITIPKEFRVALDIRQGDILEAELEHNALSLKPKTLIDKGRDHQQLQYSNI